ncbi:MAG: acyl-CoA dehydrogenase family protein [Gammaproteobacteria bacterium]
MAADEDLDALAAGIAEVLAAECSSERLHAFIDGRVDLDRTLWRQAAELGWLGIGLPGECGGLDLGDAGLAVLHRELGRRVAPGPFICTLAAVQALAALEDFPLRRALFERVIAGQASIAIPATVMDSGAPALRIEAGRLQGRLEPLLGAVDAAFALVPARAGADETWVLLEIDGIAARIAARAAWDPTRTLVALDCDGAVPAQVVAAGDAATLRRDLARQQAIAVVFDCIGAAGAVFDLTIEYMKTRVQFDRPIASFQALKHRVANLRVRLESSGQIATQALDAMVANGADADLWAALAKAEAGDHYSFIAGECVQLHGGVGFTWALDCHLYQKRAKLNQALVATSARCRDLGAHGLIEAMRAGRSTSELPL